MVGLLLEKEEPCYMFYRLDEQNAQGFKWIYICYTPDHAPVSLSLFWSSNLHSIFYTYDIPACDCEHPLFRSSFFLLKWLNEYIYCHL